LIWGGDALCEHEWGEGISGAGKNNDQTAGKIQKGNVGSIGRDYRPDSHFCIKCGAWRGQFGLEPTLELYVQHTIEILREIKRVLRRDGVCFWNIGDSYASSPPGHCKTWQHGNNDTRDGSMVRRSTVSAGLKPKDLCLIPFRVALTAQADGWYVRSVIIWNKPNPMPESVNGWRWEKHRIKVKVRSKGTRVGATPPNSHHPGQVPHRDGSFDNKSKLTKWIDCPGCEKCLPNDGLVLRKGSWRPTNSYEFILMLTKSNDYYCDADAVREEAQDWGTRDRTNFRRGTDDPLLKHHGLTNANCAKNGRNLRDVWVFPTVPFPSQFVNGEKLDHFAVFPEKLPELCIKAATSEKGCCPKCGAPWARVVDKKPSQFNIRVRDARAGRATPEEGYKATEEEIAKYPGNHPDMGYRQNYRLAAYLRLRVRPYLLYCVRPLCWIRHYFT